MSRASLLLKSVLVGGIWLASGVGGYTLLFAQGRPHRQPNHPPRAQQQGQPAQQQQQPAPLVQPNIAAGARTLPSFNGGYLGSTPNALNGWGNPLYAPYGLTNPINNPFNNPYNNPFNPLNNPLNNPFVVAQLSLNSALVAQYPLLYQNPFLLQQAPFLNIAPFAAVQNPYLPAMANTYSPMNPFPAAAANNNAINPFLQLQALNMNANANLNANGNPAGLSVPPVVGVGFAGNNNAFNPALGFRP